MSALAAPPGPRGLLPETFVHFAGIGLKTESRLWRAGVASWSELRQTGFARRPGVAEGIDRSERALAEGDLRFFFEALPASERWRTYADYRDRFAAIDIETTGMSIYDQLTVIGIELDGDYRTFVRGANLAEARDMLREAHGLISFNGALFDLPFLARAFPDLELPRTHVDLRFLSRRVGMPGSLKKVERLARLRRDDELDDIDGFEATVLWSEYEHGDIGALRKLVQYNAADTCVLRPLADLVVARLIAGLDDARRAPVDDDQLFLDVDILAPAVRRVARRPPRPPRIRRGHGDLLRVGRRTIALPPRHEVQASVTLAELRPRMAEPDARVVGIDLTGSDARPSGWALMHGDLVVTGTLHTFDQLVSRTLAARPRLVSIDSPLSLPVGRDCTDDVCDCRAVGGITRHCERELKRRGINVYPCLIQSMQALTRRGILLASTLREHGVEVIESYPGAAQDIMRIPRKRASQDQLRAGLERFGLRGIRRATELTHDELDAVTSAAVGAFYLADLYEALGNEDESHLIIPSLDELASHAAAPVSSVGSGTRLMVVGAGALNARRALGDDDVMVGDWETYWRQVATYGATLRVAHIAAADERKPRRPVFADVSIRDDHPQLTRILRRWSRGWSS
ncbi:MAG: hypothetical protein QOC78_732 [Solirubrobacteraceae bacterium]|jgi:uncharacterized protein YprB with RNaseH-like and TPR domain/predicted nuclease with RNAse H fold|nr:hypothetical protein [Solirubrobacteraceae bacterium]